MFDLPKAKDRAVETVVDRYHLALFIFTAGAHDSKVYRHEQESYIATPRIEVADTIGAGDCFSGTLVTALPFFKAYLCAPHTNSQPTERRRRVRSAGLGKRSAFTAYATACCRLSEMACD